MRQYRDPESRELKKLSANQFMDVWSHYDKDGKSAVSYAYFLSALRILDFLELLALPNFKEKWKTEKLSIDRGCEAIFFHFNKVCH